MRSNTKKIFYIPVILIITMVIASCKVKLADQINVASATPNPSVSPVATVNNPIIDSIGQVEFRKILNGDKSNVRSYTVRVSESEVDFQQIWDDHTGSKTNPLFLPKVDFELKNVVSVFVGDRPTTGYSLDIDKIDETKDEMKIFIKEVKPNPGEQVRVEITQPFLIIETKKTKKKIVFDNPSQTNQQSEALTFKSMEVGYDSGIKKFSQRVARNEKEFSDLYKEHLAGQKNVTSTVFPAINFNNNMVAVIFLGDRPTSGYSVDVKNVIKTESQIIVSAAETQPEGEAGKIVTSPFHFITLPKSDLPVSFDISLIIPPTGQVIGGETGGVKTNSLATKILVSGDSSNILNSQYSYIRNSDDFTRLWQQHYGNTNQIPEVDFALNNVIAVFIGRKDTSGYIISMGSVIETENEIRVFVEITKDGKTIKNTATSPFSMVIIPKISKPAAFIINNLAGG